MTAQTHTKGHTPGPWKVDTWADGRNVCGVATEDNQPICEMFHGGYFGSRPTSYEWKLANAHLIAAAPCLLDEHADWAKRLGYALVRVLQEDFAPITELAQELKIVFPDGEPAIYSAAISKAQGGATGDTK